MLEFYKFCHLWLSQSFKFISSLHEHTNSTDNATSQEFVNSSHVSELLDSNKTAILKRTAVPDCIPPSYDEFPDDFFGQEQRLRGGIIVHALIVAYVCCMLAIVCEKYFVPSLERISKHFNVPTDIAGATFMAIGTSSPELFSSLIGAFIAKGDIGLGTVVGSAVFNIFAVIGASGLAIGTLSLQLEWYPITRDTFFYVITISTLVLIIYDNTVTWIEAAILLSLFICYLLILYNNNSIKKIFTKKAHSSLPRRSFLYKEDLWKLPQKGLDETAPLITNKENSGHYRSYDEDSTFASSESSDLSNSTVLNIKLPYNSICFSPVASEKYDPSNKSRSIQIENDLSRMSSKISDLSSETESVSLFTPPNSLPRKIFWLLMLPANCLFCVTIPKCDTPDKLKWFPLTFLASIVWLGMLSYVSFWMVATIAFTFAIPDTVAGLTILAAGTCIPELVASIIVVRNGLANMAISNLIGSNIFDILFCLGGPWLIKTVLNSETRSFMINSSALTYTTLILLAGVILLYLAFLLHHWKLSWRIGVIALLLYAAFLVLASLYETNTFGDFNPPACLSDS